MPRRPDPLTKTTLDRMRRSAKADPAYVEARADGDQRGLVAKARRGIVTFLFRYRSPVTDKRRTWNIGPYGSLTLSQARDTAQDLFHKVTRGIDPHAEREQRRRESVTLTEAAEGYLADLEERARTGAKRGKTSSAVDARARLERNVLPTLGTERLRDVTTEQVRRLHRAMADTPSEANRTLTWLSAVFGWADRAELVDAGYNPTRHVTRFKERGGRRAFSSDELEALGAMLTEAEQTGSVPKVDDDGEPTGKRRKVPASVVLALRLLALTGMRKVEVIGHADPKRRGDREGLRWGDVDLDAGVVHLRSTKTGDQTRVLGRAAVELLTAAKPRRAKPDDAVCPGLKRDEPAWGMDNPRRAIYRAAGLDGVDVHSLRHTYASVGVHLRHGRYAAMVSPLLGHGHNVAANITQDYVTGNPDALRPAADAIAGELARLLTGGELADVVEHPSAKRDKGA